MGIKKILFIITSLLLLVCNIFLLVPPTLDHISQTRTLLIDKYKITSEHLAHKIYILYMLRDFDNLYTQSEINDIFKRIIVREKVLRFQIMNIDNEVIYDSDNVIMSNYDFDASTDLLSDKEEDKLYIIETKNNKSHAIIIYVPIYNSNNIHAYGVRFVFDLSEIDNTITYRVVTFIIANLIFIAIAFVFSNMVIALFEQKKQRESADVKE